MRYALLESLQFSVDKNCFLKTKINIAVCPCNLCTLSLKELQYNGKINRVNMEACPTSMDFHAAQDEPDDEITAVYSPVFLLGVSFSGFR